LTTAAILLAICIVFIGSSSDTDVVCETDVCKSEADNIIANLKVSIDPCQDFYDFACGNFGSKNELPADKSRLATFDVVSDTVHDRLNQVFATIATQPNSTSAKSASKPVQFISNFFVLCNDNKTSLEPLYKLVSGLGGWPMAGIESEDTSEANNWKKTLLFIVALLGEGPLVSIMVSPNPSNTSQYALTVSFILYCLNGSRTTCMRKMRCYLTHFLALFRAFSVVSKLTTICLSRQLDQPPFVVGRTELINYKNDSSSRLVVDAYKTFLRKTVVLFDHRNEKLSQDELEKQLDQVIEFEARLANVSKHTWQFYCLYFNQFIKEEAH